MNTLVRVDTASVAHSREKKGMGSISKYLFWFSLLIVGILFSGMSMVYVKDLNRRFLIQYHQLQQEKNQSLARFERLLLEYSRWSTQPFLEKASRAKLGMHIATPKEIVLVEVPGPMISEK